MIKGMELLNKNVEKRSDLNNVEYGNNCPICKKGNGVLCETHQFMTKDFDWIRFYINGLEKVDKNTLYILELCIRDRKCLIINDIRSNEGKLKIEEKLENKKTSEYMERILKEIKLLEKAKELVMKTVAMESTEVK